MAGETEEKPSGWTIDTARADILARLADMDRRYEQRFDAQEKAIAKAEASVEKRFDEIREKFITTNEFRGQLSDQAATLMPRSEAQVLFAGQDRRIDDVEKRVDDAAAQRKGLVAAWGFLAAAVAVAVGVIAIILAFT